MSCQVGNMNAPVYVLGCHRSGTTLLRNLLDTHSNICSPPETKFLAALPHLLSYPQALEGLATLNISRREYLACLRETVEKIYSKRLIEFNKRTIADKTPNYFKLAPFLRDLFDGNIKFVAIVRHPFDCALSLKAYFCDPTKPQELIYPNDPDINEHVAKFGYDIAGWCHYWLNVNETISQSLTNRDTMLVCYEDLVREPEVTVAAILKFLGEKDESEHMVAKVFEQPHIEGGDMEDKKIRLTASIHRNSVGKWKASGESWLRCDDIVRDLAYRFGYSWEPLNEKVQRIAS